MRCENVAWTLLGDKRARDHSGFQRDRKYLETCKVSCLMLATSAAVVGGAKETRSKSATLPAEALSTSDDTPFPAGPRPLESQGGHDGRRSRARALQLTFTIARGEAGKR